MKVARIKPVNQGKVRFESDLKYGELVSAQMFDPECLVIRNEDKEKLFELKTGNETKVGKYGFTVSHRDASEAITSIVSFDLPEEKVVALVANVKTHMTAIEGQVKAALSKFQEAKKDIAEV